MGDRLGLKYEKSAEAVVPTILRSKIDPEAALNNATKGSIVAAEGPFQIFEKNLILMKISFLEKIGD